MIGSIQKALRLHLLQNLPIHTSSNWFIACSTIAVTAYQAAAHKTLFDSLQTATEHVFL